MPVLKKRKPQDRLEEHRQKIADGNLRAESRIAKVINSVSDSELDIPSPESDEQVQAADGVLKQWQKKLGDCEKKLNEIEIKLDKFRTDGDGDVGQLTMASTATKSAIAEIQQIVEAKSAARAEALAQATREYKAKLQVAYNDICSQQATLITEFLRLETRKESLNKQAHSTLNTLHLGTIPGDHWGTATHKCCEKFLRDFEVGFAK